MTNPAAPPAPDHDAVSGLVCGFGAYCIWGFVVVYFKLVGHIPSLAIVAHRAVWAFAIIGAMILLTGSRSRLRALFDNRSTLRLLPVSAVLLATNWLLFIYCTITDRVLQASLAYYITPLMMTGLGVIVLGETLRRVQLLAMTLAAAGVCVLVWATGELQWMPLAIAGSWSLYSLLRRARKVPAVEGLGVELSVLVPFAFGWLAWTGPLPESSPNTPLIDVLLLAGTGLLSAIPLILFGFAATRVRLTSLGFMQYLAPTIQFLLGVLAYGEPFGWRRAIAFALIWSALGVYMFDVIQRSRKARSTRGAFLAATAKSTA